MKFETKLRRLKFTLNLSVKELASRWEVKPVSLENWLYRGREPRDFETRLKIEKDFEEHLNDKD